MVALKGLGRICVVGVLIGDVVNKVTVLLRTCSRGSRGGDRMAESYSSMAWGSGSCRFASHLQMVDPKRRCHAPTLYSIEFLYL